MILSFVLSAAILKIIATAKAATKLIFVAIRNFETGGRAVREWVATRNQRTIMLAGRFDA